MCSLIFSLSSKSTWANRHLLIPRRHPGPLLQQKAKQIIRVPRPPIGLNLGKTIRSDPRVLFNSYRKSPRGLPPAEVIASNGIVALGTKGAAGTREDSPGVVLD
jgi:hypothetical protein